MIFMMHYLNTELGVGSNQVTTPGGKVEGTEAFSWAGNRESGSSMLAGRCTVQAPSPHHLPPQLGENFKTSSAR